jgi:hypothetical protein
MRPTRDAADISGIDCSGFYELLVGPVASLCSTFQVPSGVVRVKSQCQSLLKPLSHQIKYYLTSQVFLVDIFPWSPIRRLRLYVLLHTT